MNKITGKKQLFLLGFVIILMLFALACGPEVSKKKPTTPAAKTQDIKKSPVVKSKKPKKVEKPAPVFQPQAAITLADGTVYEVADFAFYSKHRRFSGGMYYPTSGSKKWAMHLKQGPIWKKIDFAKVKSMTLSQRKSHSYWMQVKLVTTDGSTLQGSLPFQAYKNLWYRQGGINLLAKSEVLGRKGSFKCFIADLFRFERLETVEGPPKFKIIHGRKEKKETIITEPQFKITWKKATPKHLDVYKLKSNMPITVNNTDIKIKPGEIDSITVPLKSTARFTVKMKTGETVKFKLPPRVYGKLKNGDVIFSKIFVKGKRMVKKIQITGKNISIKKTRPGK